MANKIKGEVSFAVGDRKLILCYNHAALIELEDMLDKGIVAITSEMQAWQSDPLRIRLKWIRALLYVGLKKYQPLTKLDDVSEMLTAMGSGGGSAAMEAIGEAMAAAFGSGENDSGDVRPMNGDARSGTGPTSSPNTSPSDTTSPPSGK